MLMIPTREHVLLSQLPTNPVTYRHVDSTITNGGCAKRHRTPQADRRRECRTPPRHSVSLF